MKCRGRREKANLPKGAPQARPTLLPMVLPPAQAPPYRPEALRPPDLALGAQHLLVLLCMLQLPVQVLEHVLVPFPRVHDFLQGQKGSES